ncbi:hypothetical protein FSP39_012842 [Pinctada imbricata]|uniref:Amino acid transporter n=1 Tax=Pinctada imbricata TaxID=66713 RepID=A0AA89BZQ8_PINIB|nr:hypothetical protein FSP39_012842 [Pinctada imbricata]
MPGEIYMRLLKMNIVPLIVSSIITGTSSLDAKSSSKIGILSIVFIVITNAIGSVYGIIVYYVIKPGGSQMGIESETVTVTKLKTNDMFADLLRNTFPDNIVAACFQKSQTKYSLVEELSNNANTSQRFEKYQDTVEGTNILGLIIMSAIFGVATSKAGQEVKKIVVDFSFAVQELVCIVLKWVIRLTPIGVASMIAASVARLANIGKTFQDLGLYILAHTVGNLFHTLLIIPSLYVVFFRRSPVKFLGSALRSLVAAFAPPSMAMGMPEMIKCAENKNGVDARVSRFLMPLGVALERIGSCIFICLSSLFILRLEGRDISPVDVLIVGSLTTAGSLALPPVPSTAVVTVLTVLSPFDISAQHIGLLMALEWYNDRIRTISNTLTVIFGSLLINKCCEKQLTQKTNNEEDIANVASLEITVDPPVGS